MVGPDAYSVGGGSNFQCLPLDPDLAPSEAGTYARYNQLRPVHVSVNEVNNGNKALPHSQHLPCVTCEASQRPAQMMIPAKSRCPSGWNSEYKGYLMSSATATSNNYRMEYVCIDSKPESIRSKSSPTKWYGAVLYYATADCDGDNNIDYCPPYKNLQPLQCVVCTK